MKNRIRKYRRGRVPFIGIQGCALVERIAARYGTTAHAIRQPSRCRCALYPRQEAMSALRAAGFTEAAIGQYFGRDRSTVSTGAARHEQRAAWVAALVACVPEQMKAMAA